MAEADKAVQAVENEDGVTTYDFVCPRPAGCGGDDGPFQSTRWPTKKVAAERGAQHLAEHDEGVLMQDLGEFRPDRGLVPTPSGRAVPEE